MPPHVVFFWGTVLFLLGILLKSFFSGFIVILASAGIFISLSLYLLIQLNMKIESENKIPTFLRMLECCGFAVLVILGAFYYHFYNTLTKPLGIPYGHEVTIQGRVTKVEERLSVQMVNIKIKEPFEGNIRTTINLIPSVHYGDELALRGILEHPEEPYINYLKKDNIFAVMSFPEARIVKEADSSFLGSLYKISDSMQSAFSRILPAQEASLMSGLTLGDTSQFTKEFKEAMQRTGTTHIVALSGYNIIIIISAVLTLLMRFMSHRKARLVALIITIIFILLTGASASVVRAGIMAFLFIYLTAEGRIRDPKNIIAFTVLIMTLWNPRVLAYDVGFQLSFLAFIGLAYISPRLLPRLLKRGEREPQQWKQALAYTLSAQLMTLPFLLIYFGSFYVSAVIPNVLITFLVPPTMALGFFSVLFSFIFPFLSNITGLVAYPFLRVEIFIIEFFSSIAFLPISFNIGILFVILYYIILFKLFSKHNTSNN